MIRNNYKFSSFIPYLMAREYVALAFLEEVREKVVELVNVEGGSIELARLEKLLTEHYHYPFKGTVLTENEVDENPKLEVAKEKLLNYKEGMVYLRGSRF